MTSWDDEGEIRDNPHDPTPHPNPIITLIDKSPGVCHSPKGRSDSIAFDLMLLGPDRSIVGAGRHGSTFLSLSLMGAVLTETGVG